MQKEDIRVGDVLKIRQWDDMADEFGVNSFGSIFIEDDCTSFIPQMKDLCGKIFTVKKIFGRRYYKIESEEGVELAGDVGGWTITPGMLEPFEDDDMYIASDDELICLIESQDRELKI